MNKKIIALLVLALAVGLAAAPKVVTPKKPAIPAFNGSNCEEIAFYVQSWYHMDLVFIQQLKPNGSYDLTSNGTTAHWMNAKTIHGVRYYFDYTKLLGQTIYKGKQAIHNRYNDLGGMKVEIYDFGLNEKPPFGIHYQWKTK